MLIIFHMFRRNARSTATAWAEACNTNATPHTNHPIHAHSHPKWNINENNSITHSFKRRISIAINSNAFAVEHSVMHTHNTHTQHIRPLIVSKSNYISVMFCWQSGSVFIRTRLSWRDTYSLSEYHCGRSCVIFVCGVCLLFVVLSLFCDVYTGA